VLVSCRTNWKSKKKKKKKGKDDRLDLYALLGLQNERWTATDAQIKLGETPAQEMSVSHQGSTHNSVELVASIASMPQAHNQRMLEAPSSGAVLLDFSQY